MHNNTNAETSKPKEKNHISLTPFTTFSSHSLKPHPIIAWVKSQVFSALWKAKRLGSSWILFYGKLFCTMEPSENLMKPKNPNYAQKRIIIVYENKILFSHLSFQTLPPLPEICLWTAKDSWTTRLKTSSLQYPKIRRKIIALFQTYKFH